MNEIDEKLIKNVLKQIKGKLGHVVKISVAVNVILNFSNSFSVRARLK